MVRPMYALEQELNAFIREKREMQQSELTIHQYEWTLHRSIPSCCNDFKEAGEPAEDSPGGPGVVEG